MWWRYIVAFFILILFCESINHKLVFFPDFLTFATNLEVGHFWFLMVWCFYFVGFLCCSWKWLQDNTQGEGPLEHLQKFAQYLKVFTILKKGPLLPKLKTLLKWNEMKWWFIQILSYKKYFYNGMNQRETKYFVNSRSYQCCKGKNMYIA